jgi:hypothetical protein
MGPLARQDDLHLGYVATLRFDIHRLHAADGSQQYFSGEARTGDASFELPVADLTR